MINKYPIFSIFLTILVAYTSCGDTVAQSRCKEQSPLSQRTITVKNHITRDSLKVHYWGMQYWPDTFSLSIYEPESRPKELFSYANKDKKESSLQPCQVVLENNRITLDYSYSFARGVSKATKRVHFDVPLNTQTIEVSFSFDNEQRVLIPQAQFIGPIESVS